MSGNQRLSQVSKNRKAGRIRKFVPDLKEWAEACELYPYDKQIVKHFDICNETFYAFLDRERYKEEQGETSEFLAAYKNGRNRTRKFVVANILKLAEQGDTSASIFAAKTYGELIEAKDIKHIELKKYEVAFRTKQFLTELGNKFSLSYEELKEFAELYFKDLKLDDI